MSNTEYEQLRKDYDDIKQKWDYYQDLCKLHGVNGITELIVQRDDYAKQLKEVIKPLITYRHIKTGNEYNFIGICKYKSEDGMWIDCVVYGDEYASEKMYVRPINQFMTMFEEIGDEENDNTQN